MGDFFNPDNLIWKYLGRIWDAIVLTVLFLVFSLPIITVGASATASCYVAQKIMKDEEGNVAKQFLSSFKLNFGQATALWLIFAAVGGILGGNLYMAYQRGDMAGRAILVPMAIFAVIYLFVIHWIFQVEARFSNNLGGELALALVFAFRNFAWTMFMVVITGCVIAICLFVTQALLIVAVGFIALLDAWVCNMAFQKYIDENNLETNC